MATLVKLIRVAMLAPVIFGLVLLNRHEVKNTAEKRSPLLPGFVVAFIVLATVNSLGAIPDFLGALLTDISSWSLLTAMAAVGMKTSIRSMLDIGGPAIVIIVAETAFIALFIPIGMAVLNV